MTNTINALPIAVHLASGGDARVRTGGRVISLNGTSSGSVQLSGATRFRGVFSPRSTAGLMLLIGYTSPLTVENASWLVGDLAQFSDDVPDGTTVYFRGVSSDDLSPMNGGVTDTVHLSFYA